MGPKLKKILKISPQNLSPHKCFQFSECTFLKQLFYYIRKYNAQPIMEEPTKRIVWYSKMSGPLLIANQKQHGSNCKKTIPITEA